MGCNCRVKLANKPKPYFGQIFYLFRAIFDLSNKIALLILRRMFALKVKKSKKLKIDWRVIFLAQFMLAQDSAWLSLARLGSAWPSLALLGSAQPGLTRLSKAIGSILALKFKRSPFCSNAFEFFKNRIICLYLGTYIH